jgi:diguanylate cyclase (GGDEF)-like protein
MTNGSLGSTLSADELRGFSRTFSLIEWLTAMLVSLYVIFAQPTGYALRLGTGTLLFAPFVLAFRTFGSRRRESNWNLVTETSVMIVFITWVVLYTGKLESPLINLYLLVVITSALTLGRTITAVQIALICGCYVWLATPWSRLSDAAYVASLVALLAPVVMVGCVTTMLSSDIRRALLQIKDLSQTDELTGVLNMRAFRAFALTVARQALRYRHPYSVVMIDSDSLKTVNDRFGHEAGNCLLKMLVQCIRAHIRQSDILARYGGDEFLVLLPETGPGGAEKMALRVRERVEAAGVDIAGELVRTTVSIGIASYPEHATELESVIELADKALYASKSEGKNRVTIVPDSRNTVAETAQVS